MDMPEHSLTADEAIMDMERFRTFAINNGVVAQSAGTAYFVWLIQQLSSGQHSLASDDDDDGRQDEANQFDTESGYPIEETVQAGQQVHPMMILSFLAPHLGVDFEAAADRVLGEGVYDDDGGVGLVGAFVVPTSDAVVAGLEKQAFHATAEGCGITGCAICLEDFEDGEEVTVMPCSGGHEFHSGCITEWLGNSNTCPLCRHALPTDVDDGP